MPTVGNSGPVPPPAGFHSVTPRMVVSDVAAEVEFLRTVFDAAGEVHVDRPAEIHIGDSLVMVTAAGDRELFPAFLYVYVDDADLVFRRALAAGAVSLEDPVDTPYGDRRAMVRDPLGNVFQIAHRKARWPAPEAGWRTLTAPTRPVATRSVSAPRFQPLNRNQPEWSDRGRLGAGGQVLDVHTVAQLTAPRRVAERLGAPRARLRPARPRGGRPPRSPRGAAGPMHPVPGCPSKSDSSGTAVRNCHQQLTHHK